MSYDLVVFETSKAPNTTVEFLQWFEVQSKWEEDHDYQTIGVSSDALRNWFMEIKDTFPQMNGEFSPTDDEITGEMESYLTDYSIGRDMIYAGFAWSKAEEAYVKVVQLAAKHGVGFFDISGEGDIFLPDGTMM